MRYIDIEYLNKLVFDYIEMSLKKLYIKSFDYSQFSNLHLIGKGGFSFVYSVTFQGKEYALKILNKNLNMDSKTTKLFIREVIYYFCI
jgi:predicted Ser/Thr protein kinase